LILLPVAATNCAQKSPPTPDTSEALAQRRHDDFQTCSRKDNSRRNVPSATSFSQIAIRAAITRTFDLSSIASLAAVRARTMPFQNVAKIFRRVSGSSRRFRRASASLYRAPRTSHFAFRGPCERARRTVSNNSLQQRSDMRAVKATARRPGRRGLKMHALANRSLAHTASAANSKRRPTRARPRNFARHLVSSASLAPTSRSALPVARELNILVANLIQFSASSCAGLGFLKHGH